MYQKQKGFTLTEMMVTVCLIGIIGAISTGSVNMLTNKKSPTIADSLKIAIMYAKSEAVKTRQVVKLKPLVNTWESGWKVVSVDSDGVEVVLREFSPLPTALTMASDDFNNVEPPTFFPTGILAKSGSFNIVANGAAEGANRDVTVLISGQVQIKKA